MTRNSDEDSDDDQGGDDDGDAQSGAFSAFSQGELQSHVVSGYRSRHFGYPVVSGYPDYPYLSGYPDTRIIRLSLTDVRESRPPVIFVPHQSHHCKRLSVSAP